MTLQELQKQHAIDPEMIRIWTKRESATLLSIQEDAIREHHVLAGSDLLVSAPTSSGKTFLAEIAAIHTIYQRKQVIYLLPLKALAEEKYADFSEKYRDFGLDIVISTSDRTAFDESIERGDFHLAVIVFEKATRLLVRNKHFLDNCGLIIIDEIQMTADYSRGSSLEMLLTAILYTRRQDLKGLEKPFRSSRPQLIALSAVIGDLNQLDRWLGMELLLSDRRPVELREGILRKDGTLTYRGFISKEIGTEQFPPFPTHGQFNLKSAEGKREYQYKRLQHYVSCLLAQGEQVLIFRKWRWLTRETALRLAQNLQLPPALEALEAIHEMEDSISKEMLIESLRHGIAFHNADLGSDERRAIEHYFREENSKIRIICATSTLAMGINLPVNTVIINDLEKPDPFSGIFQEIPLSSAEYKNMSGRAGRLKRHDEGRSIIFADTPAEENILWRNYIEGTFPRMDSLLATSSLVSETLFLLASEICLSEHELLDFMMHSYAGTLYWKNTPTSDAMAEKIHAAIEFCIAHELVIRTAINTLRTTEIGRICAAQGVSVETFVTLIHLFELIDPANCDPWELIFIVLHNRELDTLHFRLAQAAYESGDYWRALQELAPNNREMFVKKSEELLQDRFEVTKRIKMSLVLLDWMAGTSLQQLEIKYSQFYRDKSYSGVIRGLAENTSWMTRLLADIAAIQHADQRAIARLHMLSKMMLYGVEERAVELASLHIAGLTRTMITRLAEAGYSQEEHVLDAELADLGRVIPREIAFRLQEKLYKKYSRTETRYLVNQKLRLERLGYESTLLKQVYSASTLNEFDQALRQIFRTPQINVILGESMSTQEQEKYGRDYIIEQETGPVLLRILPPNVREISDEHLANLLTVGVKYNPVACVFIGRPDLTEATYIRAQQFSEAYSKHLTLYPAYEICERYVQALEGDTEFTLTL